MHKDQAHAYQVHTALPDKFIAALEQAITTTTDYLAENPMSIHGEGELQRFYFDALHFSRMSELFDVTNDVGKDATKVAKITGNPEKCVSRNTRANGLLCQKSRQFF